MEKIYVFFAPGFEDIEALSIIDVCRRANLNVVTVSTTGEQSVVSAHNVPIVTDALFEELDYSDAALIFLPGGMPGATNLYAHEGLREVILAQYEAGKPLGAICAAPLVYGRMGLLKGRKTTCYPGFEGELQGAIPTGELIVCDDQFFLGKGPGAALRLGYAIVEHFCGKAKADEICAGMLYPDAIKAGLA